MVNARMLRTKLAEPKRPVTTESVSKIKLYVDDHKLAAAMAEEAQSVFRQLTIQELLREAIHIGLPAVIKRYRAAVEAAKAADAE